MLKNQLTLPLLLFTLATYGYNYSMEDRKREWRKELNFPMQNEEEQDYLVVYFDARDNQEPEDYPMSEEESTQIYTMQLFTRLMSSIRDSNLDDFNKTIDEIAQNMSSRQIRILLNTLETTSKLTPLTLAKSLQNYQTKRKIITTLKNHGAPHKMGAKNFEDCLARLDHKNMQMQTELMRYIKEANLELMRDFLELIDNKLKMVIESKEKKRSVIKNFQFLLLLNEPDPTTGHTPLTLATELGFVNKVELLVNCGAIPNKINKNRQKPIDIANLYEEGNPKKERLLSILKPKIALLSPEDFFKSPAYLERLKQATEEDAKAEKEEEEARQLLSSISWDPLEN